MKDKFKKAAVLAALAALGAFLQAFGLPAELVHIVGF